MSDSLKERLETLAIVIGGGREPRIDRAVETLLNAKRRITQLEAEVERLKKIEARWLELETKFGDLQGVYVEKPRAALHPQGTDDAAADA